MAKICWEIQSFSFRIAIDLVVIGLEISIYIWDGFQKKQAKVACKSWKICDGLKVKGKGWKTTLLMEKRNLGDWLNIVLVNVFLSFWWKKTHRHSEASVATENMV